jgi:hypothetical protein
MRQISLPLPDCAKAARWQHYAAISLIMFIHFAVFLMMASAILNATPGSLRTAGSTELEVRLIKPKPG